MACSRDFYSNEAENAGVEYDFKPVKEDKALECPVCMLLLRQTMGTPCSHLFCLSCVQKLTERRDIRGTTFRCPVCNNVVDTNQVFPNAYIDRCVRGFDVYCQQQKRGCAWKGTIAEYFNKHENECDLKIVPCKHEECDVSVMRRKMNDHELHCPFRIVQCNHCTFEVKENELNIHYQSCEKFPTNCKENGCNIIVPKNEMVDHLSICDFVNVDCPYLRFGCLDKVPRKNIENHLEVRTQRHMMLVCEKYHNMEEVIVKQNTEIEQLKKRISLLETKPKVTLAKSQNEQNLKNPSCPFIGIDELLLKGADRWIRKKEIDFDENNYDVWFQKISELMYENTLYRYDNVVYLKLEIERKTAVLWYLNNKKQQARMSRTESVIHKGKDGLLLEGVRDQLAIHTLFIFKSDNSSFVILHPQQHQKMMHTKPCGFSDRGFFYYFGNYDVRDDFFVNNFLIVCLIRKGS